MPSIEEAIYSRLTTFSGLTSLIAAGAVFPHPAEEDTPYPFISYQRQSAIYEESLVGSVGLARPRYYVTVWSQSFDDLPAIAEQIRLALHGFSGTIAGVVIDYIKYWSDQDLYDENAKVHYRQLDFEIWHTQPIPA